MPSARRRRCRDDSNRDSLCSALRENYTRQKAQSREDKKMTFVLFSSQMRQDSTWTSDDRCITFTTVNCGIYPALADGQFSLYHGKFLLFWTTFTNVSNGFYTGDTFYRSKVNAFTTVNVSRVNTAYKIDQSIEFSQSTTYWVGELDNNELHCCLVKYQSIHVVV